jgi:hypothetical protein
MKVRASAHALPSILEQEERRSRTFSGSRTSVPTAPFCLMWEHPAASSSVSSHVIRISWTSAFGSHPRMCQPEARVISEMAASLAHCKTDGGQKHLSRPKDSGWVRTTFMVAGIVASLRATSNSQLPLKHGTFQSFAAWTWETATRRETVAAIVIRAMLMKGGWVG